MDVPALMARMRPKQVAKDYWSKIKHKPFHCKHKNCHRRFKKSETLMLHYHLHNNELKARQYVEEEKQRLLENKTMEHRRHEQRLIQLQQQTSQTRQTSIAVPRKEASVTAASNKATWAQDIRLGRKDAVLKGLSQGYFLVNVRDSHDRKTPLIIASRWGEGPLCKSLLLRKADVSAVDMHGNSSLAFASQYGHLNIVQQLIGVKNGGKEMINVLNNTMLSPLHRAAMYNHADVIQWLLKEGGDARAKDAAHRTPLDYARLYSHHKGTAVLEEWEVMLDKVVAGGGAFEKHDE